MSPAVLRPVLLDVTRLVSRVGGGPLTGIDRVERAMLRSLLARDVELNGLCRTAGGFALLPRPGLAGLARRLDGDDPWGRPDAAGRLSLRIPPARRAAEADVRRLASGAARGPGLGALLRARLPAGTAYLNMGHSNLADPVFEAVRAIPAARIGVMIHDVIPLRLPWSQRPGASARFAEKLAVVARHADVVFCPSAAEGAHVTKALADRGGDAAVVVAPLGIDICAPDPDAVLPPAPYFVAVGTMEPRKNLSLLLDLWDHLAATLPPGRLPGLHLIGRRGWEDDQFFRRLDAMIARMPEVRVHENLPDPARAALVAGARALLFPSLAEGYGLPPLEALAMGVTPVCAPLPAYRETLGDAAVYADPHEMYQWAGVVGGMMTSGPLKANGVGAPPSWDSLVNQVLVTVA
jgi:glycosyltransferase involved in cell wall biosynthesis